MRLLKLWYAGHLLRRARAHGARCDHLLDRVAAMLEVRT